MATKKKVTKKKKGWVHPANRGKTETAKRATKAKKDGTRKGKNATAAGNTAAALKIAGEAMGDKRQTYHPPKKKTKKKVK